MYLCLLFGILYNIIRPVWCFKHVSHMLGICVLEYVFLMFRFEFESLMFFMWNTLWFYKQVSESVSWCCFYVFRCQKSWKTHSICHEVILTKTPGGSLCQSDKPTKNALLMLLAPYNYKLMKTRMNYSNYNYIYHENHSYWSSLHQHISIVWGPTL